MELTKTGHGALRQGGDGEAGVGAVVRGQGRTVDYVQPRITEDFMAGIDHTASQGSADAAAAQDMRDEK